METVFTRGGLASFLNITPNIYPSVAYTLIYLELIFFRCNEYFSYGVDFVWCHSHVTDLPVYLYMSYYVLENDMLFIYFRLFLLYISLYNIKKILYALSRIDQDRKRDKLLLEWSNILFKVLLI